MRVALIAGATGLVGKACLYALLENKAYTRIIALVRKPLAIKHHKLHQVIVDFENLNQAASEMMADDVYCCLGTTIKVAGSQENFKKVDYHYPIELAKIGLQNGATRFMVVSAMGANPQSAIFYNKTKGEMETAMKQLSYHFIGIFQPSLLLGDRKELRVGELIGKAVMKGLGFLFLGPLKKYKAIQAVVVAKAMITMALGNLEGIHTYQNDNIFEIEASK